MYWHQKVSTNKILIFVRSLFGKLMNDLNEIIKVNILPIKCMLKKGIRIEKNAHKRVHSLSSATIYNINVVNYRYFSDKNIFAFMCIKCCSSFSVTRMHNVQYCFKNECFLITSRHCSRNDFRIHLLSP